MASFWCKNQKSGNFLKLTLMLPCDTKELAGADLEVTEADPMSGAEWRTSYEDLQLLDNN